MRASTVVSAAEGRTSTAAGSKRRRSARSEHTSASEFHRPLQGESQRDGRPGRPRQRQRHRRIADPDRQGTTVLESAGRDLATGKAKRSAQGEGAERRTRPTAIERGPRAHAQVCATPAVHEPERTDAPAELSQDDEVPRPRASGSRGRPPPRAALDRLTIIASRQRPASTRKPEDSDRDRPRTSGPAGGIADQQADEARNTQRRTPASEERARHDDRATKADGGTRGSIGARSRYEHRTGRPAKHATGRSRRVCGRHRRSRSERCRR